MAIRAVVFDIGGVLEITPDLGVAPMWETRLGLPAGELNERMHDAWVGGTRLDVRPDETVFVDDTVYCVAGAREAGMHAVHFQHNAQVIEDIEKLLASS